MGESEGELIRVSRRAVAARVGLWMNPVNWGCGMYMCVWCICVCVYVCMCVVYMCFCMCGVCMCVDICEWCVYVSMW